LDALVADVATTDSGQPADATPGPDSSADATTDAGFDAAPDAFVADASDAGCASTMSIVGGSPTQAFGATWSAGGWNVLAVASTSLADVPTVVPFSAGWLAVARASSNALVSSRWAAGTWSPPAQIGAATTAGAPALATLLGNAHALYVGSDLKYYHATFTAGAWDTGTDPVGGSGASQDNGPSAPSAAATGGDLYVAFGGNDANLYVSPYVGTSWQAAIQVASSISNTVPPRIVALTGGTADLLVVFVSASTSGLQYATRTAGTWSSPSAIPGGTSSYQVSIAPEPAGGAYLVYEGTDGKPYTTAFSGGAWSAPAPLLSTGNPVLSSPPQVAPGICGDAAEVTYVAGGSVHVVRVAAGGTVTDASPASLTGTWASIASSP
jgi:hypothetical protein